MLLPPRSGPTADVLAEAGPITLPADLFAVRARVLLGQVQEKQLASEQNVQRQTSAKAELEQQIARIIKSAESVAGRRPVWP